MLSVTSAGAPGNGREQGGQRERLDGYGDLWRSTLGVCRLAISHRKNRYPNQAARKAATSTSTALQPALTVPGGQGALKCGPVPLLAYRDAAARQGPLLQSKGPDRHARERAIPSSLGRGNASNLAGRGGGGTATRRPESMLFPRSPGSYGARLW